MMSGYQAHVGHGQQPEPEERHYAWKVRSHCRLHKDVFYRKLKLDARTHDVYVHLIVLVTIAGFVV